MSTRLVAELTCDWCGRAVVSDGPAIYDVARQRADAADHGWSCRHGYAGMVDLCPSCTGGPS